MTLVRKLIEVALPLNAINKASAAEKAVRHGLPSSLHRWWARRPLSTARAVIFAQMVDDPSSHPDTFPTEEAQETERQRLFRVIEDLVLPDSTDNENVLEKARAEIWKSWRATCALNSDPSIMGLYDPEILPGFLDPFAGGGALPLEAQRLGLRSYASDLNPVAVLINKAMIEIPPRFRDKAPVNRDSHKESRLVANEWSNLDGLAEDVRYYGDWIRNEAKKSIGYLYPAVNITEKVAQDRPDLKPLVGEQLDVIAWIWARTVKSPNPAFAKVDVPLASSFVLSAKTGKEAHVEVLVRDGSYAFVVRAGKSLDATAKNGTKLTRGANFRCVMSGEPISPDYIRTEGKAGRIGSRLMAVVAEGKRGRIYLSPSHAMESVARSAVPAWRPDIPISGSSQYLGARGYGMELFAQLFTDRQLVALTTFMGLLQPVRNIVRLDAISAGMPDDNRSLDEGGSGASAYADAVVVYLAMAISKTADSNNALCPWEPVAQCSRQLFGRQAIPMLWDFAEANPLHDSSGGLATNIDVSLRAFHCFPAEGPQGFAQQMDACQLDAPSLRIISTDPPYYDNVPYADLSDFFYVWLRLPLKSVLPTLFATVDTPKNQELVAFAYRHNGKAGAEAFFLEGMTGAMHRLASVAHPAFPVTLYYAFRQSESEGIDGIASTGWETFLEAVIRAGFSITGTWPMRTEMTAALKEKRNALASSIVLVCRPRVTESLVITRHQFISTLKNELPSALAHLQKGNVAPVDLAQSAIGPGMSVYTRYTRVLDAEGNSLTVRDALALINQILDEVLSEQEGDFDTDTRWALSWFDQYGFGEGEYGVAETLCKAKNTSVARLAEESIITFKSGKVRLLQPSNMPSKSETMSESDLTVWEMVHYLIKELEDQGESAAARLMSRFGSRVETARELPYRLYTMCERTKRAREALSYNGLVQSWPEISRLARAGDGRLSETSPMFDLR